MCFIFWDLKRNLFSSMRSNKCVTLYPNLSAPVIGRPVNTYRLFLNVAAAGEPATKEVACKGLPRPKASKVWECLKWANNKSLSLRWEKCLWHFTAAFFRCEFLEITAYRKGFPGRLPARRTPWSDPTERSLNHPAHFTIVLRWYWVPGAERPVFWCALPFDRS